MTIVNVYLAHNFLSVSKKFLPLAVRPPLSYTTQVNSSKTYFSKALMSEPPHNLEIITTYKIYVQLKLHNRECSFSSYHPRPSVCLTRGRINAPSVLFLSELSQLSPHSHPTGTDPSLSTSPLAIIYLRILVMCEGCRVCRNFTFFHNRQHVKMIPDVNASTVRCCLRFLLCLSGCMKQYASQCHQLSSICFSSCFLSS